MKNFYYLIKRKIMKIRCLFGRHDFKMGVPAKTGGGFGCLWCRKVAPKPFTYHRKSWSATNAPTNVCNVDEEVDKKCPSNVGKGSNRQNSNETDPFLTEAERQVRRLFGGKA